VAIINAAGAAVNSTTTAQESAHPTQSAIKACRIGRIVQSVK